MRTKFKYLLKDLLYHSVYSEHHTIMFRTVFLALIIAVVSADPQGIAVTVYDAQNCPSNANAQLTYYLSNDWTQCQALPAAGGQFLVGHARCEVNKLIVEYCGNRSCSAVTCFGPTTTVTSSGQCDSNLFLSSGSVKVQCPENSHQLWLDQRPYIVAWVGTGFFFLTSLVFFILFCKARHSDPIRDRLIH